MSWVWCQGRRDVLAGRGAGFGRFVGVKGVDDVLAGVEQGAYGGVYGDGAVDGVVHFSRSSRSSGVERQFFEPSSTHTCECSRAPCN